MPEATVPPPVERIDVETLLAAVNQRAGAGLHFLGRAEHGAVGAGFVQWPDGRLAVVTRSGAARSQLEATGRVLAAAADQGLPVPHYQLIVDLGRDRAIVQERLPGAPPSTITAALVTELVALIDRCSGLGTLPGVEPIELHLTSSGPGFCLHETLLAYDGRSQRLLDRIRQIGRDIEPADGDDLVHLDFHPGNVLVEDDRISGWVDWDGYGRGDRRLALVTLLFDFGYRRLFLPSGRELSDGELAPVLAGLAGAPVDQVHLWWAHMGLRQVDWAIRHGYPRAEVDFYLALASRGLDRLESGEIPTVTDLSPPEVTWSRRDSNR